MRHTKSVLTLAGVCLALVLGSCATSPRVFPPVRGIRVIAEELVTVGGGGGGMIIVVSAFGGVITPPPSPLLTALIKGCPFSS